MQQKGCGFRWGFFPSMTSKGDCEPDNRSWDDLAALTARHRPPWRWVRIENNVPCGTELSAVERNVLPSWNEMFNVIAGGVVARKGYLCRIGHLRPEPQIGLGVAIM